MTPMDLAVNFFIALFALIDPVGNVPLFAAATTGAQPAARRRIALYIALFVAGFLAFFFLTGLGLLKFFGISLAAFRIAGGIMLLLLGLDMARDDLTAAFPAPEVDENHDPGVYARKHFERLIVPFGMPLLIGPGAISAVVIFASEAESKLGVLGYAYGLAAIAAVAASVLIAFLATDYISRLFGKIGMMIVVRVLGLVLCALAVQFIIVGVSQATEGIIRASAAHPYPAAKIGAPN
jgi:multiple antibiotic resistance protein